MSKVPRDRIELSTHGFSVQSRSKRATKVARALARGAITVRTARALFGVTGSLRAPRTTGPLSRSGLRSALGGAS